MYLDQLRWILEDANQNPPGPPGPPNANGGGRPRGVFQSAPYLPLQLVMNIKSEGPPTLGALTSALQPFLQQGWLTTVDTTTPGAQLKQSALTIVVTGNVLLRDVLNTAGPLRYIFYDAPLKGLDQDQDFNPSVSPMASASFSSIVGSRWVIPKLARQKILEYVNIAHSKGIAVRITELIDFPVWIRNMYWQMLLDCGVDWLDVEDLYSAGQF